MTTDLATTVLGLAGAVLGASIAVPQAWRAVRTGTAGISATTFQLLFSLGLTWMLYGIAEGLVLVRSVVRRRSVRAAVGA